MSTLVVRDADTLAKLPEIVEAAKPDTLHFPVNVVADNVPSVKAFDELLKVIFPHIGRTIEIYNTFADEGNRRAKLSCWDFHRTMLRNGWDEEVDFDCFSKPYLSKVSFDWSYIPDKFVSSGSLAAFDPYAVYNRVLAGTFEKAEDTVNALREIGPVDHWIEIMSGTAKAALALSYSHASLDFTLVDLDVDSFTFNKRYPWNPDVSVKRLVGDVLKKTTYAKAKPSKPKEAVVFVGKQSFSLFNIGQLEELVSNSLSIARFVILEMGGLESAAHDEPYDYELAMLGKLGGKVTLTNVQPANPISQRVKFALLAHDAKGKTSHLFTPPYDFRLYHPSYLCNLAEKNGWQVHWYNSSKKAFVPVGELNNDNVIDEGVNTMMVTAR